MKNCTISYEKDKHFLLGEFADAISNESFCEGDIVVVCEKCNAIMHESSWINNGNLCGACEGTVLKDISHKYLKSYNPNVIKKNIASNEMNDSEKIENNNDITTDSKKNSRINGIKPFMIIMIIIAVISGIAYASSNHQLVDVDDSYVADVSTESETIQEDYKAVEETTIPTVKELSISQIEKRNITIENAFVGNDICVDEASPKLYSGYISEGSPANEYSFTAPRSGRYNFSIENIMATASTRLRVYDEYDSCIIDTYSGSSYKDLDGKKTYRIIVSHESGESSFDLVIGVQKKTVDISDSSTIYDQISFENQKNKYSFTPPISGRYRFDITEANANNSFRFMMWDDKDSNIADTYSDGFYKVLDAGKTYEIQIRQDTGIGSYCLKVGFQKPTTDITGYTRIIDSIEYSDQKNVYMFTPDVSGRYRLDITESNANNDYRLMVWDHLEKTIVDTYSSGSYLNLDKGETYEIQVRHDSGYGGYTLNIGYQKEKKDISDYELIHDSIEFEDQINRYKYIPTQSKEYCFSLTNYDARCSFETIIFDEYDNVLADTYSEDISVNLEAGKEYTIKICQDSKYSDYTLNIE